MCVERTLMILALTPEKQQQTRPIKEWLRYYRCWIDSVTQLTCGLAGCSCHKQRRHPDIPHDRRPILGKWRIAILRRSAWRVVVVFVPHAEYSQVDQLHEIIDQAINEQSKLLWIWRTRIHSLLTQKLTNDDDDSPDGEEYQRTLESQGEAETYLQAYQALLADRKASISHERTVLATHDTRFVAITIKSSLDLLLKIVYFFREKQLRKTKAAIKAVAEATEPESFDIQPEHEVLRSSPLLQAITKHSLGVTEGAE